MGEFDDFDGVEPYTEKEAEELMKQLGKEPVGIMFCLDCMAKHSRDIIHDLESGDFDNQELADSIRDLEHHMEDATRVDKPNRETWNNYIDALRDLRKVILYGTGEHPEEYIRSIKLMRSDILKKQKQDPEEECQTCQG